MSDLVSVVIPVYNVEKYLEKCLDSVVNQTYDNIEVVVMNDGSPDGSQNIIDQYKIKYPDIIKAYQHQNSGPSATRNRAIKLARGKYIFFLDGDDYLELDFIERLHTVAQRYNSDIVIGGYQEVDEQFNKGKEVPASPREEVMDRGRPGFFIACGKLYLTDFLIDNDLWFPVGKLYEDQAFCLKSHNIGKNIKAISYIGYNYLQRSGSTTSKKVDVSKFPFEEIEHVVASVAEEIPREDYERFEFDVIYMFAGLLYQMYRRASVSEVIEAADFMERILNSYFKRYWKNKYIKEYKNIIPFVIRHAIKVFMTAGKFGCLKVSAILITRF